MTDAEIEYAFRYAFIRHVCGWRGRIRDLRENRCPACGKKYQAPAREWRREEPDRTKA